MNGSVFFYKPEIYKKISVNPRILQKLLQKINILPSSCKGRGGMYYVYNLFVSLHKNVQHGSKYIVFCVDKWHALQTVFEGICGLFQHKKSRLMDER